MTRAPDAATTSELTRRLLELGYPWEQLAGMTVYQMAELVALWEAAREDGSGGTPQPPQAPGTTPNQTMVQDGILWQWLPGRTDAFGGEEPGQWAFVERVEPTAAEAAETERARAEAEAFAQRRFQERAGESALDRAARLREFNLELAESQRRFTPSLDDLINQKIIAGEFQTPEQLNFINALADFRDRPTSQQQLDAALAYARSPADVFTLSNIARGNLLVPPPEAGQVQRIGAPPDFLTAAYNRYRQSLDLFGAGGFPQTAPPVAGAGATSQAAFGPGIGATPAALANQVGYGGPGLRDPIAAEKLRQEQLRTAALQQKYDAETARIAAAAEAERQRLAAAAAGTTTGGAGTGTAPPPVAPPSVYETGGFDPITYTPPSVVTPTVLPWTPELQATDPYSFGGLDVAPPVAPPSTALQPAFEPSLDLSQYPEFFAHGGVNLDPRPDVVGEFGPEFVNLPIGTRITPARGQPAGVQQLLSGRSLRRPRSLFRAAGLRVPSTQALRRLLPSELAAYAELGRLAGIPEAEFNRELVSAAPGFGSRRLRFRPFRPRFG